MGNSKAANYAGQDAPALVGQGGKYLTFQLGKEVYGLEILRVQEIIGMMSVTRVPGSPEFVRGVINLRGKIIPVVDLRLKFGLESQPDTEKTCIIVAQVVRAEQEVTMGIIVDEVSEVLDIAGDQIEPPPSFRSAVDTDFILGMGKVGRKVVVLLDVDRVLSAGEFALVDQGAQSP
ncbi:MAG TPA: chemotaxis protein CheW [Phycisphaerae bacterium]|nr:chemotaxis protein CheW [Phycisphaerae bacterium]